MNLRTDFADELIKKKSEEYDKSSKSYKGVKLTKINVLKIRINLTNKKENIYLLSLKICMMKTQEILYQNY